MSEAAVRESGEYSAFALVDGRLSIADFNRFSKFSRHLHFAGLGMRLNYPSAFPALVSPCSAVSHIIRARHM